MALIENIQRENLNPLEEARALDRLIEEFRPDPSAGSRGGGAFAGRRSATCCACWSCADSRSKRMVEDGASWKWVMRVAFWA